MIRRRSRRRCSYVADQQGGLLPPGRADAEGGLRSQAQEQRPQRTGAVGVDRTQRRQQQQPGVPNPAVDENAVLLPVGRARQSRPSAR